MFHFFCSFGLIELEPIDSTRHEEVYCGLTPQAPELVDHVSGFSPHGIKSYERPCSERAGEEPADALPEARDVALWPACSRKEEERDTDEDHE